MAIFTQQKRIIYRLLAAAVLGMAIFSACAVRAETKTETKTGTKVIICGKKQLCTIGTATVKGELSRVCYRVRDLKKDKYDYECMDKKLYPTDCKNKERYKCKLIEQSEEDGHLVNGGKPVTLQDITKYQGYKEEYSKDDKKKLPSCASLKGADAACMCHNVVCRKGTICIESDVRTNQAEGAQTFKDWYCKNREAAISEGKSNFVSQQTVAATDGAKIDEEIAANTPGDEHINTCASTASILAKYSGCWGCLVVEKVTSAFMWAAHYGLKVCRQAGFILLMVGFPLWLAVWALKNVSSFTELKLGNILNELLKTCGKVVLAYVCISYATTAIRNYIITPIMGVGTTIATNFWPAKDYSDHLKGIQGENFEWEEITEADIEAMHEVVGDIVSASENSTPVPQESEQSSTVLTEAEQAENASISEENDANFAKSAIPNLLIPGVQGGWITSGAGCRNISGGSTCHMGVDAGVPKPKDGCIKYIAAGPGTIHYIKVGGYGRVALINHGKVGKYYWVTTYNHMGSNTASIQKQYNLRTGVQVKQTQVIGCAGGSSYSHKTGKIDENAYGLHVHFDVFALERQPGGSWPGRFQVDPLALVGGRIIFMDKEICPHCNGKNRYISQAAAKVLGCTVPSDAKNWPNSCMKAIGTGFPAAGEAVVNLNPGDIVMEASADDDQQSLVAEIPDVTYTGPSDIMPKSVMNSIINATKAITNNVAMFQVLGQMGICFSNTEGLGAWTIGLTSIGLTVTITNFFMWIDGAVLWVAGFILSCVISFYLVDMSFKIGFAAMALPVVMGLWPYKVTQDKLAAVISIIARSSCNFAFLAITSYYGLELMAAIYQEGETGSGGIEGMFKDYDTLMLDPEAKENEELKSSFGNYFYLFSTTFLLMLFAVLYTYKLISNTAKDLVNKFFPDSLFGDSSPMHKGMTAMASMVNNLNKKFGMGLAADMVSHKAGQAVKHKAMQANLLRRQGGRAITDGARMLAQKSPAVNKVAQAGKKVTNGVSKVVNFIMGKGDGK